jgi:molybdate transport system substrate-binding protein
MRPSHVVLLLLVALLLPPTGRAERATVFAAASLGDAFTAIGRDFEQHSGRHRLRFSFAATSVLARQIEAGAPADLFASASVEWMDYLARRGHVDTATRFAPIGNRLVLVASRAGSPRRQAGLPTAGELDTLLGERGRLALADTRHVPAGIYALQALQATGLWGVVARRLAVTDNVRAALALVARRETPLGIVYASDTRLSPDVLTLATFPEGSHVPIRYPMALLTEAPAPDAARAFAHHLRGAGAARRFREHGFEPILPDSPPAVEAIDAR